MVITFLVLESLVFECLEFAILTFRNPILTFWQNFKDSKGGDKIE
jgi:hypothetical protein